MAGAMHACEFCFSEELGDFLSPERRKRSFMHAFRGTPLVKDQIEALGVPHTEVDLVLVDGESVGFTHRLRGGERVAVYPVFERLDVAGLTRLRPEPLREPRFVLDVHLGRLAAYLRLLGFDCVYYNDLRDEEIVRIARAERRIVLSRDVGLLKNGLVERGAYLHHTDPMRQVREVLDRFDLERLVRPYTRCARCNAAVVRLEPAAAKARVPPRVAAAFDDFSHCPACDQVFWPGTHCERLRERFAAIGVAFERR
jgi:hypothetical protein